MGATLSDDDHELMDAFLAHAFEGVRAARLTRDEFVEHLAYAMTALDVGNRDEARWVFEQGVSRLPRTECEPPRTHPRHVSGTSRGKRLKPYLVSVAHQG